LHTHETPWWQRTAVYQIYPRSFADSDGDGVGDLRGIAAHLDYLTELGVGAVWLSPIFTSPMADYGYDVADYRDVDPLFGTLADLDRLVAEAHARGLKILLDWVPGHTSDAHPWFVESRSDRSNPKRDWYVWRDPAPDGGPPNDWVSAFPAVGRAWTLDEGTGQYYLHSFMPQQPDLNWDNPEVEAAMHDTLRFWLDRGIDGFRLDAIMKIAKDPELRDDAGAERRHSEDWETIHDRLRGIRRVVDEYDDRMIVGEVYLLDLARLVSYVNGGDQLHMAHNFVFAELPWSARAFRDSIAEFDALAEDTVWPAWFLSNHDKPRVASRFDQDGQGAARARAIGLMLFALRGTPFVYQGEELGLPNADIPPERVVDVDGRDPERAPIPWRPPSEAGPGAGFTTGEPWLPVVGAAEDLAVERQEADPRSTLALFKRLAELRAQTPALVTGEQRIVDAGDDVLAWVREGDGDQLLGAVNFATEPVPLRLPPDLSGSGRVLISTDPDRSEGEVEPDDGFALAPSEGVVVRFSR
jgi:alpha-glucosidase